MLMKSLPQLQPHQGALEHTLEHSSVLSASNNADDDGGDGVPVCLCLSLTFVVCSTTPRGSDDAPTPAASAASSSSVEGFSLNTSRPICMVVGGGGW